MQASVDNLDFEGWTRELNQLRFAGPQMHGRFDFDAAHGFISGTMESDPFAGLCEVFRLGRLECRKADRKVHLVPAKAIEAVIQQPHLVVPYSFDDPAGFQATQRVTVREASLDCEVRLLTVKTVESVAMEIGLRSAPARPFFAWDCTDEVLAEHLDFTVHRSGHIVALGYSEEPFACVFADVGENGRVLTPTGGRPNTNVGGLYDSLNVGAVRIEFFHRPLEKGVILVGRASLRTWTTDLAQLRSDFENWFGETPFL